MTENTKHISSWAELFARAKLLQPHCRSRPMIGFWPLQRTRTVDREASERATFGSRRLRNVYTWPRNFARPYSKTRGRTPAKTVEAIRIDAPRRRLEETADRRLLKIAASLTSSKCGQFEVRP